MGVSPPPPVPMEREKETREAYAKGLEFISACTLALMRLATDCMEMFFICCVYLFHGNCVYASSYETRD